ncbi:MAG: GFA family protein [Betaproteobacteria bacterium]|jgi:hypothetical protein
MSEGKSFTATCACGAVQLSLNSPPTDHGVCHCTNCKRRTGSAFGISMYFARSAVTSQTGETTVYRLHNRAHNHDQERHFCSRCGTTLFWFVSTLPDAIGVAGGCFADAPLGVPTYSTNDRKIESWITLPQELTRYPGTDS